MKNTITTIAVAIISCMTATAQRTPKHEFDFEKVTVGGEKKEINWKNLYRFFDSWQPGTPPCGLSRIDDEFFISRQRPLKRITDGDYQVRNDVEAERRMFLWTPLDDPTTKWKALPRYCFEGDNFSMWQYIDTHGNWSAPWLRVSAGISDAAAKNGVTVGCVLSVPWDAEVGDTVKADYSQTLMKLAERNTDGSFRNSLKLARLMKYYGINALSNNLIMVDRKLLKNPNGLILGTPGSGKSFSAKREIANCFLLTSDDVIICDPEAEYAPLVERLHGQVIKISPTSTNYINPMDLNLDYSDDESPLSLKSDFILSLCELIVGGKEGLQPVQKTIIDRCVRLVYNEYLNDPKPENMPILEDLYNLLREQEEKEAQYIATALEIYVTGSLNVFNHQSNVDIDNRIVCYDIKELGKQLKKIGMLVVQDQVWNRVTINRAAHKSTRYYIDEMHLLLKEEQTAAYTVEIWKRFRKWGGIPTGITQNVKDLLSSREVENIFENSDFVYMLNQAGGDRQILAKQLGISTHQLSYVTHSGEGEGLLFYGSTILPFVDHFPKNTELYRIMTTKPQELKKEDE